MMQGYELNAAVAAIAPVVGRAAHVPKPEAEDFVRRAIDADMRYMQQSGVLTADGLMGDGEYDDDDAFEALFEALSEGLEDEEAIGRMGQMLDAYMGAQQDYLEENGLMG